MLEMCVAMYVTGDEMGCKNLPCARKMLESNAQSERLDQVLTLWRTGNLTWRLHKINCWHLLNLYVVQQAGLNLGVWRMATAAETQGAGRMRHPFLPGEMVEVRDALVVHFAAVKDEVDRIVKEQTEHRGWKRTAAMAIRDAVSNVSCNKLWSVHPETLAAEELGERQQW